MRTPSVTPASPCLKAPIGFHGSMPVFGRRAFSLSAATAKERCMCGICGIVNFSVPEPVDRRVLERMTAVQAHRGPDDEGFFIDNNAGLGHRRLSIIDLSGGK